MHAATPGVSRPPPDRAPQPCIRPGIRASLQQQGCTPVRRKRAQQRVVAEGVEGGRRGGGFRGEAGGGGGRPRAAPPPAAPQRTIRGGLPGCRVPEGAVAPVAEG